MTTPSAPSKAALRHFLYGAAPPPFQGGEYADYLRAGLDTPDLAPFSIRNATTVSYLSAFALSSAVRPSVLEAFTSTPSSTASLTASRARASRSARSG